MAGSDPFSLWFCRIIALQDFPIHFEMLFLDGVYVERPDGALRLPWMKAPILRDQVR
jgi:hypothetical protein